MKKKIASLLIGTIVATMFFSGAIKYDEVKAEDSAFTSIKIDESKKLIDMKARSAFETTKKKAKENKKLGPLEEIPPRGVRVVAKFKKKLLSFDLGEQPVDEAVYFESTKYSGHMAIYIRQGNILSRIFAFCAEWEDACPVPAGEREIISDKCKRILNHSSQGWGYLSTDGEFYYFGTNVFGWEPYTPGVYDDDDEPNNVFGDNWNTEYDNHKLMDGFDDAWACDDYLFYEKENEIYIFGPGSSQDNTTVFFAENIGKVIDVDMFSLKNAWVTDAKNTYFVVTEDGDVYARGYNSGYLFNDSKAVYMSALPAEKLPLPYKVRDIEVVDNCGVFALSDSGDLYYWGCPGVKYKSNDEMLNSPENIGRIVPVSKPAKVMENVKSIFSMNKTVMVLDVKGNVYEVNSVAEKKKKVYKTKINKVKFATGVEKIVAYGMYVKDGKLLFDPSRARGHNLHILGSFSFDSTYGNVDGKVSKLYDYWWINYNNKFKGFYTDTDYKIMNGVDQVEGMLFKKKNNWYKFKTNGKAKKTKLKAKKVVYADGAKVYIKNNNLYSDKPKRYTGYKPRKKRSNKLIEKNVSNVWADGENIAFVKNGTLYSYGTLEELRWYEDDFDYGYNEKEYKPPRNLVKYSGIEVDDIADIRFYYTNRKFMCIRMKNGDLYKIYPEQKENKFWYRKKCKIIDEMKIMSNINDYHFIVTDLIYPLKYVEGILDNKGNLVVNYQEHNGRDDIVYKTLKTYSFENIKKYGVSRNGYNQGIGIHLMLTNDGDLYGWGNNTCNELTNDSTKEYSIEDKVLIAKNVKDFSIPNYDNDENTGCINYLTNDGSLYFRGCYGIFQEMI